MNTTNTPQNNTPPSDPRGFTVPPRDQHVSIPHRQQQAAANVIRGQIEKIYQTDPPNQPKNEQTTPEDPYQRTYNTGPQAAHLEQYHTAWQQYYQQYYQRYYVQQLHHQRQQQAAAKAQAAAASHSDAKEAVITGVNPDAQADSTQLVNEFKQELLRKVGERAKKVRRSHHFMPIISALVVGGLFLFLQFNRVMIAQVKAYVSPGSLTNDTVLVEPTASTAVGPEPKLLIPKINVDVPVVYGLQSLEEKPVQDALRGGVVHYPIPGASALPGEVGNTVIVGHSSNDVFDPGAYKFAFVLLDRLQNGDIFYINHQGKRYIYRVNDRKIVSPKELNSLQITTNKPIASLVTCTPAGTALQRLVIIGEQISPDPTSAHTASVTTPQSQAPAAIPGNSPTFFERIIDFFTN